MEEAAKAARFRVREGELAKVSAPVPLVKGVMP
jgi:hypothetical protein